MPTVRVVEERPADFATTAGGGAGRFHGEMRRVPSMFGAEISGKKLIGIQDIEEMGSLA